MPVAAAVWAVCGCAPLLTATQLALGAVGATGLAGGRRRDDGRAGRRPWPWPCSPGWPSPSRWRPSAATAREASPLRSAAEAGRTVELVLELDGDPHVLPGAAAPGSSPTPPSPP